MVITAIVEDLLFAGDADSYPWAKIIRRFEKHLNNDSEIEVKSTLGDTAHGCTARKHGHFGLPKLT